MRYPNTTRGGRQHLSTSTQVALSLSTTPTTLDAVESAMAMTTKAKIVILEVAMFGGIVVSAFHMPRSFPLKLFIEIGLGVLISGNVLLFRALKQPHSESKYRMRPRAYFGIALMVLYWVVVALWR